MCYYIYVGSWFPGSAGMKKGFNMEAKKEITVIEEIRVGDFVRSYDFEGREDCYAEGTVEEVGVELEGCPRYKIRVTKRIFGGKPLPDEDWKSDGPNGDFVYPPVNGTQSIFGGVTTFVKQVRPPKEESKPKPKKPKLKRFIIFWERIANSGVIGPVEATSADEAIEKYGYRTEFVKHSVIQVPKRAKLKVVGVAN